MKAVHFGGGNIGRGFIGLLLSQAGYQVTFVDVDQELVRQLQERRQYSVVYAGDEQQSFTVDHVTAIIGSDQAQVAEAVAEADLVTTAVGVNVLKHIAGSIASGIVRRLEKSGSPLVLIACENAIGGSTQLQSLVYGHLTEQQQAEASRMAFFPDAAVDRIVPLQQHEDRLKVLVEPYYEWVVDRSSLPPGHKEIPGVHYADQLQPYIERKLFTVNTGHCCAAYHGYLQGFDTIQEVMKQPTIVAQVEGAMQETGSALIAQYGFDANEHKRYTQTILERFRNPHLTDEVVRVGRSPIRKLSPNDRLVRPALVAYELGIETPYLTKAMAAALLFDYQDDPEAAQIQQTISRDGISSAVTAFTGLEENHPLHAAVREAYATLKTERSDRV
ncbi:mannitol-1-phosphate 5-dehydrogenase [Paenibacillus sp. 1011MAR3C5]|uniref:mannitol-1-phosphate 5-dehydrogenase n=1 Tax=Paenibacillus sp. 1011MAR3C5 TaxID=1675787 RepID=UPI000E6B830B|nr:mannitol-1-phosphate 5-dehydrogenase [Paenibacillus sp. 1011MAR3C5]RJE90527.1 mannitol-1-phosphate 5-dehydrogenase [Paenibacillus sp. 1011MAR3C5]